MVKSVSVLKGLAGSGKSSTMREVIKILEGSNAKLIARFPRARREAGHIFELNGMIIGVIGAGDNEEQIRRRFEWLQKYNCNIVICASRPSQMMVEHTINLIWKYFGHDSHFHWVEKVEAANELLKQSENEQSAHELLSPYTKLLPIQPLLFLYQ